MTHSSNPLEGWHEEKQSAWLYSVVSEEEADAGRATLFRELGKAAEEQAGIWADLARQRGIALPTAFHPDLRARLVGHLIRLLKPRRLRGILAAMKVRGMSLYASGATPHRMPLSVEEVGRRHQTSGTGNNLRAAVFGINDGLLSNASLILGVAGATSENGLVLLSGVAGLLAGAFSMASGEYVSVRSQREMFEYQIGLEREELDQYPQEEAAELALIYTAKGIPRDEARSLADRLIQDPKRALDTLAREELGLNPDELGSPLGAALSSFVAFSLGAVIPLAPFLFSSGVSALRISIVLTGMALFTVGAALSLFTGRLAIRGGLRMLLIGAVAGGATYVIGHLLGVTLG
ncbi:MAG TPA: VIT1/CCC1 transporter family protein [Thiobacillaceae bacterium]|nr:VIT1/CCC1 transporter family protein [Thiobacillaceae bacterium]